MRYLGICLLIWWCAGGAYAQKYPCLSSDHSLSDRVSSPINGSVATALKKLKAHCLLGRLIDRNGKEIRLFSLQGCWGNPPEDHLEILEAQRREIARLSKKYTVIQVSCSVGSEPLN